MGPSSKLLWLHSSWKQLLVPSTMVGYCNEVSVPHNWLPYMLSVIQLCLTIYTSLYIHSCTSIDIQICNDFLSLSPPLTSTHCIILQLVSDCSVFVTSRMTGGSTTGWGERRSFSLLFITGEKEREKQMYIHSQSLERGRRRQDQNLNTCHTTWKLSSSSKQDWHMDRMLPLSQETCADIVFRAVHNVFCKGGNQEENCLTFFEIVESVQSRSTCTSSLSVSTHVPCIRMCINSAQLGRKACRQV